MAEGTDRVLIGKQIGAYKITALLGAGGMGEVYQAEDTRLGRTVAVKVLPTDLAQDKERLHRFVREARAASALNHACVAHIYEIGQSHGVHFIAMEYVEGQSLAHKMLGQPLDLEEILDIGIQTADALEEAHRKGITHRDIKSANLMITPKRQVKVLDFGLAKMTRPEGEVAGSDVSTSIHTTKGRVMGTLGYMSPEQVLGKELDGRTDLFSLGVVLYEITTGRLPFSGSLASEVTDRILHAQPEAMARFNYEVPTELERIVRKCLEKDRERRYQLAREVRADLIKLKEERAAPAVTTPVKSPASSQVATQPKMSWTSPEALGPGAPRENVAPAQSSGALGQGELRAANTARNVQAASRFFSRTAALWFAAGACSALVILLLLYPTRPPVARKPIKVEVTTGVRLTETSAFAVSPDGRRLVFAGSGADGVVRLWVRSLDASEARPLPGTEVALGGIVPPMFWSPDSRFVAFDAIGQLKKVDVTGGSPQTVCTLPNGAIGGSWNQDDVIVVGSPQGGLVRCPASGGAASIVTQLDTSRQESAHVLPWFLPDGRRFLYLGVSRAAPENSAIYVHTLDARPETTSSTRILAAGFGAAYVPDGERDRGHLLFMRDGALFAQAFDPARLQLTGEAARIAEPVGSFLDGAFFSTSRNGVLAFRTPDDTLRLTWLDRRGNILGRVGERGRYNALALAPDETRAVVVQQAIRATVDQDLWLVDLPSGRSSRLTFDATLEERPVWFEDSKRIVFTTGGGIGSLFEQSISGEQGARLLLQSSQYEIPSSISRDGRFLLCSSATIGPTRVDVWVLPLTGERKPYPLIRRAFDQHSAQFSPDGRWVAYVSNESGRQEVLVRRFAPVPTSDAESAGESVIVSRSGGMAPRWRADGKELFFLTPEGAIASVPVSVHPVLAVGSPTTLFQAPGIAADWSVSADGSRFLVMAPEVSTASTTFSLIFDWQGTLDQRR